jgi:hypothetical protein
MNLWRQVFTISVALIVTATARLADAQIQAGTYPCATVTINGAGQITAISAARVFSSRCRNCGSPPVGALPFTQPATCCAMPAERPR